MRYLITFLEGLMSFVSPCMLPLLPVYLSYFAGGTAKRKRVILKALFFVLGFTMIFCLMGVFAGSLGALLVRHQRIVDLITGCIVILFGLCTMELIRLPSLHRKNRAGSVNSVFSAFLFGMIYSVSLTPCVGAFLGSALMLASQSGTVLKGLLLLLVYSMGLGIPFLLSAVLIDRLRNTFRWIKEHYRATQLFCGGFLILVGLLMAFGLLNSILRSFL